MKNSCCFFGIMYPPPIVGREEDNIQELKIKDFKNYLLASINKLNGGNFHFLIYLCTKKTERIEAKKQSDNYRIEVSKHGNTFHKTYCSKIDFINDLLQIVLSNINSQNLKFKMRDKTNYVIRYHQSTQKTEIEISATELPKFILEQMPILMQTSTYFMIYSYKTGSSLTIETENKNYLIEYMTSNGVCYKEFLTIDDVILAVSAISSGINPQDIGFEYECM